MIETELFVSDFCFDNVHKTFTRDEIAAQIKEVEAEVARKNKEIKELVEKVESLKKELSFFDEIIIPPLRLKEPSVSRFSPDELKIETYLSYFDGRKDVYASRRWNKKKEKIEYYPVCLNRWSDVCIINNPTRGVPATSNPCVSCKARKYDKLSASVLKTKHFKNTDLSGIGAIGIYPMHLDDTCSFVAIDLDEKDYETDARAIISVAREYGFPMVPERSFSGNGMHLWLFFSERIGAAKARQAISFLLDATSMRYRMISLNSYDRIFPTQDKLSSGGLGNLILLPFVYSAMTRGCTSFLDDNFKPYKDQFEFLSSIPKLSEKALDEFILSQCVLYQDFFSDINNMDDVEFLWKRKLPVLDQSDIKKEPLTLHLGSGISIVKKNLSNRFLLFLRKMCSFSNQQYYMLKNQYHGKAPMNINSIIESYVENEDVIWIPRAFENPLVKSLERANIRYEISNHRISNDHLNISFNGSLDKRQQQALDALIKQKCGVLNAATGFGKTIVALALVAELKQPTLILVDSVSLMEQWKRQIEKFLCIKTPVSKDRLKRNNKNGVGVIGNQKDCPTGIVDIAMIQTIYSKCSDSRPDFLDDYGLVIVDECHHVAADSFMSVLQNIRSKFVYGLSATVKRKNGDEKLIYAYCGQIAFKITAAEMSRNNKIVQILIPRFTHSKLSNNQIRQVSAIKELVADKSRNEQIVSDVVDAFGNGRRILVLSSLVEHTILIGKMLSLKNIPNVVINGQLSKKNIQKRITDIMENDSNQVIVATSQLMGEGMDIPFLDTLFLATPSSFEGITIQQAGRISRKVDGKEKVFIYDYVDYHIDYFMNMYFKRMRTYSKLGYMIKEDVSTLQEQSSFFGQERLGKPLVHSFENAKRSIDILSPILLPSRFTKNLICELSNAKKRGVELFVKTDNSNTEYKDLYDKAKELFIDADIKIREAYCASCFVVIDAEEIWFGNISVFGLSNAKSPNDRYMMHFYDRKVAKDLLSLKDEFLIF